MKKMSIVTGCVCVGLSVSALALPALAESDFSSAVGMVLEKETPVEFMEDFIADALEESETEVFLTEEQIALSKDLVIETLKRELKLNILPDMAFTWSAEKWPVVNGDSYSINFDWTSTVSDDIRYSAFLSYSEEMDLLTVPATLGSISAFAIPYDDRLYDSFKAQAVKAFADELDIQVNEDYDLHLRLDYSPPAAYGPEKKLTMIWWNEDAGNIARSYAAHFMDADLDRQTGAVSSLTYDEDDMTNPQNYMQNKFPIFAQTEEEQNAMLETAKSFLANKGVTVGALRSSTPGNLGTAILFRFEADDDSMMNTISVVVSEDLKVIGYIL